MIHILQVRQPGVREVKCWLGQGHRESHPLVKSVAISWTSEPRLSVPCEEESSSSISRSGVTSVLPEGRQQAGAHAVAASVSCGGWCVSLFDAAWADITEHSSKSQGPVRLRFPEGPKRWMKRHCYADVFTPHPTVPKFGARDILA